MEETHVHAVYEAIAPHFSNTRYKPWPLVEKFLLEQEKGSIGVDVGCGNGKYIRYNHVYLMGCDRSLNLVEIARKETSERKNNGDVFTSDGLNVPIRPVDFAISIAVIHHFHTPERRIEAIRHVLSKVKKGGKAMFYVWALEQKNARANFNVEKKQDVMVPYVVPTTKEVHERYYHLYKENELLLDAQEAGGTIVDHGYERDNWYVIVTH
ncbi:tRNA (carboxymethyluridine(34)-5-O)-methyltransferase [Starmerella bacillaris]|uniref:tRNA (Carboxymethyluridine(34)-5-O)-methyltransferase n=1 Tax=Starmerella bacillaris TaxID=1247836 RepID=A0AAV5RCH3_STABA|nr:tRNA (carboxymethyluridine(34)-5-O)-methyltransferase [Starmerella bacillaris]